MNKDLITILKDLKNIRPEAGYSEQSKMLILSSPQNKIQDSRFKIQDSILNWFNLKHFLMSAGALTILTTIILLTISYLPGNKNSLIAEANEINASIKIKIDEINYHIKNKPVDFSTANNIQNLLKITADNLIKAQEELKSDPDKIKTAVEKIKEAENTIIEINKLLTQ